MIKAIYPGSFDPITYGHLDIIERGLGVFDHIVVAVAHNIEKEGLFTLEERKVLIEEATRDLDGVTVDSFEGLLVDYLERVGGSVIIRGLRATSDFEYEFHMASINRHLNENFDTFFMMTAKDYFFVSSRTIKEVAMLGGCVKGLVPENVEKALKIKFNALTG
ncbi:MAG: pantetheine-phosphate adenylyltransferase [Deltaproteobacteria bacterium]|nr:MAG: pantetheine-phosphate adenylyltransferase [Deltaproteobacteria bacterium]